MTAELGDNYEDSENEIDDRRHARLLENVLNLDTKQHVKKPSRTEPTLEISEFNLVKSITGTKGTINLQDLTTSLKKRAKHVKLSNKVKNAELRSKTLQKPLEKPQAERIRRTVAYANTKKLLDRWEPVVTANRAATTASFPLETDTKLDTNPDFSRGWRLKTNLELELEKIEPTAETYQVEADTQYPLTMEEMEERRKEFDQLRRYQNYKEAKARRQNKIKSKKYRKILRRERVKQQMKEFELLQKTNPEEALKKLEKIEKARAEERASLRHKSTGKWAKSHQIRAKYNKESRKTLAEQLAISKDLTQKLQVNNSSDSEGEDDGTVNVDLNQNGDNPWIKSMTEVDEFVSGYQKFLEQQNKQQDLTKNESVAECENNSGKTDTIPQVAVDVAVHNANNDNDFNAHLKNEAFSNTKLKRNNKVKESKPRKRKHLSELLSTSKDWEISVVNRSNETFVDDVFDNLEYQLKNRTQKKFKDIAKHKLVIEDGRNNKNRKLKVKNKKSYLYLPRQTKKPIINEKLMENVDSNLDAARTKEFDVLKSIIVIKEVKTIEDLNPSTLKNGEPVNLDTELPDLLTYDENEEETDQRGTIAEAFEDDDITDEFAKNKKEEIDKDTPKDIDLTLPGWGVWGGTNMQPSKRRTKRFIIKFPKEMPRKDKNKGDLIINENANKKIKSHLVSELPFPFKSVKDFEASVRAPIGNTFVTEIAFRRLTQPAISTKLGTIITPMSEDVLLKKDHKNKKKKRL